MIEFRETQRFQSLVIWAVMIALTGFTMYALVRQVFFGEPVGDNPVPNAGLWMMVVLVILLDVLFASARLITVVNKDGIFFKFFPFHWNFHKVRWETVEHTELVEHNVLRKYGGWGIRVGFGGKGMAYLVAGKHALLIDRGKSMHIVIGTQRPDDLKKVLDKLGDPSLSQESDS